MHNGQNMLNKSNGDIYFTKAYTQVGLSLIQGTVAQLAETPFQHSDAGQ